MSGLGLGRVKTQACCGAVEWRSQASDALSFSARGLQRWRIGAGKTDIGRSRSSTLNWSLRCGTTTPTTA